MESLWQFLPLALLIAAAIAALLVLFRFERRVRLAIEDRARRTIRRGSDASPVSNSSEGW
ncbi:hypothetical protein HY504_00390 [Candidatus Wolfebacteria bacterium]|nr:hypothetical protein [Candidatus Wolfebacteria bacterium]